MKPGENVLWQLHATLDSADAYHSGADISMFSQYEKEDEILFPPMTMMKVVKPALPLEVMKNKGKEVQTVLNVLSHFQSRFSKEEVKHMQATSEKDKDGDKHFTAIDVLPCFL